jgi:hypothetical protein
MAVASGNIVFDKDGQPHITQKMADQVNAERKQSAIDQAQHDADLQVAMKKFMADPSYARQPTMFQKAELMAAETAIEAVQTAGPILPTALKK